jgi:hypothetical protein
VSTYSIFRVLRTSIGKNDRIKTNRSQGDYIVQYNNGKGNISIAFNICEYAQRTCPDVVADYANIINENNTCNHISSKSLSEVGVNFIDSSRPDLGLKLNFTGGNMCNKTDKYVLEVQLNCDLNAGSRVSYELDTTSIKNPCSPKVIMSTSYACPVLSLGTLWHFFN